MAGAICKGTVSHGTGCGVCPKCEKEIERFRESSPVSLLVDEDILNAWEASVEDKQLLEIVRLAKAGLWAYRHANAIKDSLQYALGKLSPAVISRFERALDQIPKGTL